MAAHAAVPTRQPLSTHGWGVPVTLGFAYGFWAAAIQRSGGIITWNQVGLGLASGILLAVGVYALNQWGHVLPVELRAAAWAVLMGCAVGFLYSLSDNSVLSASGLGLVAAAVTGVASFYLFYTHEDTAEDTPAPSRPPARTTS
ncbi:hypothetical protein AB0D99_13085 [Streptomyces sp. NPDC047971]|uniref:hypothetical protein n=1 Tax=Streptomyces sp. NPDC047971 TaxID=3154499 RepID=UPI0033FC764E